MRQAVVSEMLKSIRRSSGTAQSAKQPLPTAQVRIVIEVLLATLQGRCDRALLLVGFARGSRRSELAAVTVEDMTFCDEGVVILVRWSKTDQKGKGRRVALPRGSQPLTCPVGALREYLQASGMVTGPVSRCINRHGRIEGQALHKDSIGLIVKRAVRRIGLGPA